MEYSNTQHAQFSNYQENPVPPVPPVKPEKLFPKTPDKSIFAKIRDVVLGTRVLLVVIIIIQLAMTYFVINPPFIYELNLTKQIVDEVSKLTVVNTFETPTINVISDVEKIKAANTIQAQVYKNAKNGDYVLGFSDKMIIYRREGKQIIYDGDSPTTILTKTQTALTQKFTTKAVKAGLVSQAEADKETPQLSVVTDADALKAQDAKFYADVKKDDIVGVYVSKSLIIIYRPDTDEIIKTGTAKTTITVK
jgi:hypothetical protein